MAFEELDEMIVSEDSNLMGDIDAIIEEVEEAIDDIYYGDDEHDNDIIDLLIGDEEVVEDDSADSYDLLGCDGEDNCCGGEEECLGDEEYIGFTDISDELAIEAVNAYTVDAIIEAVLEGDIEND